MMKRTLFVHCIISGVIGMAVGSFLQTAVSEGSMAHGILCIIAVIGFVLNMLCGPDDSEE